MAHPKYLIRNGECFWLQTSGRYYQAERPDLGERLLHRRIWTEAHGAIAEGWVVHHKDGDWTNNEIGNLEAMPHSDHARMHLKERMQNPEARKRASDGLRKAQEKATKWHRSRAGRAWHSKNGKEVWKNRKELTNTCAVCQSPFKTFWPRSKYCSKSCMQRDYYAVRYKTAKGICALCGNGFVYNKYRTQKCCSRTCAIRLRHGW